MNSLQNVKVVKVTTPGAIVDNAAFTTTTLDTYGWGEALFVVELGALDIAIAAFKLTESNDSGMAGAVDVSGADFSVSPATLPAGTDDNLIFGIHVKLGGNRKRYMDLSITGGDGALGTYLAATVILSKGSEQPATAAEQGFSQCLYV